jgi:hypothetical protein
MGMSGKDPYDIAPTLASVYRHERSFVTPWGAAHRALSSSVRSSVAVRPAIEPAAAKDARNRPRR